MVFAHQGGWDEVAMVALPIVLFALILWRANRQAAKRDDAAERGRD